MKDSKFLSYILKDFFTACGVVMVMALIFLSIYSTEIVSISVFWQIILLASAAALFKNAYANKYELTSKWQLINFTICSSMADILLVLWLSLFSPGKINDNNLLVIYITIVIIVKAAVYAMMYINSQNQAKELNDKLKQYKTNE